MPPPRALESLAAVVDSVGPAAELDRVPIEAMQITVTHFGKVALGDRRRLLDELAASVPRLGPPLQLRFAGAAALEWPGDCSVWAKLAGDLDALGDIARGVSPVARRVGFMVDRRAFRPWLSVGLVTPSTTVEYLSRLVEALDTCTEPEWVLPDLCLVRTRWDGAGTDIASYEVLERFPLCGPVTRTTG
ncbi:MAG: 2'-5' RNA ligase family protein [Nocardioidaceae bacterium]